jgi:hypothetical protein
LIPNRPYRFGLLRSFPFRFFFLNKPIRRS